MGRYARSGFLERTTALVVAGAMAAVVPMTTCDLTGLQPIPSAEAAIAQRTATATTSSAKIASAEQELERAQSELQRLCATQPGLKAELDSALAELEAAQPAYDKAQHKRALGSKGFFEEHEASAASQALETATYASATSLGTEGDATSLENMRRSFQFMEECNAIRKAEGLHALKVTHSMMAYAQSNVNWSVDNIAHARQFNVGENLSWGCDCKAYEFGKAGNADSFDNPFCVWYDMEKANKESGEGEVGHYRNIVMKQYTVTGFAVADGGDYHVCHSQTFQWRVPNDEKTYSVKEYEQLFEDYLAPILAAEEKYTHAKEDVAKAEAEHNGAGEKIEEAEKAVAAAQKALKVARAEASRVTLNTRSVSAAKVNAAVAAKGATVNTLVLGPKVSRIGSKAFASTPARQVKTIEVRTKKLTKASVKNSIRGSKVTTIKVKVGSKAANKRYVKAYKKIFTQKNAGKKVAVK